MFRNWVFQNFPFLENDFDALTDYELFCKMMEYVKEFAKDNEEFKKQLDTYENYFKNLDVQEEINNKLDEMASDGTLAEIINEEIFNELNDKIDAISESTLIHITNELPQELEDNNEYQLIENENNIEINDLPVSYYENLYNAQKLTEENLLNDVIKVGTFNIQNEDVPYTDGVSGNIKLTKLQNIFNKLGCSILGLNECFADNVYGGTYKTEFLNNFNMVTTWNNILPGMNYGEGILSNMSYSSSSNEIYDSYHEPEHQGYVKNVYSYNNKIISFYCTHFCYNDDTTLQNQISELFTVVQADNNPYKIIVGDFNFDLTESSTYLTSFLNNGFKLVNGGQYKTYDDSRNLALDEIMVSSNIEILSSGVGNSNYIEGLSDHFPVWCTIKLGSEE